MCTSFSNKRMGNKSINIVSFTLVSTELQIFHSRHVKLHFPKGSLLWRCHLLIPSTDALLAPSDTTLAYPGCAILLDGQKIWLSRQIHCPFLPHSSSLPWCKGAKTGVGGGQKRVRVRYVLLTSSFWFKHLFRKVTSKKINPFNQITTYRRNRATFLD